METWIIAIISAVSFIMFFSIMISAPEKFFSETKNLPDFITKCYFDSDCEWEITNCCGEMAGARWECVNEKTFQSPECPGMILCPQVISPRPTTDCVCKQGSCLT